MGIGIDYLVNPPAVVKTFDILYGPESDSHLTGRIIGIIEEGYDEVNWFNSQIIYPRALKERGRLVEIGGSEPNLGFPGYVDMKKGGSTLEEAEERLREFCANYNLPIASSELVTGGVIWKT